MPPSSSSPDRSARRPRLVNLPRLLLTPLPVPLLQILLNRVVRRVADKHTGLFSRLTGHTHKRFLITPTNLPFLFVLRPDPANPRMEIHRAPAAPAHEASIRGTFINLLRLIDGQMDGDALFFSRDLKIEGDVEAIVCLRNALDDIEGSIAQDAAETFGPLGPWLLQALRKMEI